MKRLNPFAICSFVILVLLNVQASATEAYPSNWFVQMKWNKVQVLLRSVDADFRKATIAINFPGVSVQKIHHFENGHYIAVDLLIAANAKPGIVPIQIKEGSRITTHSWPLKPRRKGNGTNFAQGVNQSDLIYFLMPDRFSNGDTKNDQIAGFKDQTLNRDSIFLRHGGDLKGVQNHLDYLQDLGATTLWMTPILENDMPNSTEHGYAATNHYTV